MSGRRELTAVDLSDYMMVMTMNLLRKGWYFTSLT